MRLTWKAWRPIKRRWGRAGVVVAVMALVLLVVGGGSVMAALFGGTNKSNDSSDINLQKGLVGYWNFNGNAKDQTPNGNNGTVTSATLTTDRKGRANSAYSFDGSASHIDVADSPSLNFGNNITVSAWFYPTSSASYQPIVAKVASGYASGWEMANSSGAYRVTTRGAGANITSGTFTLNKWHMITFSVSGTTLSLYGDGVLLSTTTASTTTLNTTAPLTIGTRSADNLRFSGSIDDVHIWNRAISQAEVTGLYKEYDTSVKTDAGQNGLVGYWKLDGNLKDASPYARNGTATGTVAATTDRKNGAAKAMSFSGASTSAVDTGYSYPLQTFTVSLWAKPDGTGPSSFATLISNTRNCCSTNSGFQLEYDKAGTATARLWAGGASPVANITASMPLNTWGLYTMTYDGTTFKLYKNGALASSAAYSGTLAAPLYDVFLGKMGAIASNYSYGGSLDDVRIYNRALSLTEVSNLYNSYNSQINLLSNPNASPNVNLNVGQVGYWPFNGNAKDATPYADDGTVTSATATTDRKGRANSAYSFNGTNSTITINDSVALSPTTAISYSAWISGTVQNTSYATSGGVVGILSKDIGGTSGANPPYSILINNGIASCTTNSSANTNVSVNYSSTLLDNQWYLITCTYDGTTLKMYLNGVLNATTATQTNIDDTTGPLRIGMQKSGYVRNFNGTIDDVRIWNRALSQAEVTAMYKEYR